MLNTYGTRVALNLAVALLFCSNISHIFTKHADISQNVLLTKYNFCIFSYDVTYIEKKTNNKLLLRMFLLHLSAKIFQNFTNTLKIAGNYVIQLSNKGIFLFV